MDSSFLKEPVEKFPQDECPLFFRNHENRRLFGILHKGSSGVSRTCETAIVFCSPLLEEKQNSHRVLVNFARYAAAHGISVLRFDYFGDGESEGMFEDATISSRIRDIGAAIKFVKESVSPSTLVLIGLRMGGTLAFLASSRSSNVDGVIAWAPIIKGSTYVTTLLRSNIARQMVIHKRVIQNREGLIRMIRSGKSINVDGYEITKDFFEEAMNLDLENHLSTYAKPALIIGIGSNVTRNPQTAQQEYEVTPGNISREYIQEERFWMPLESLKTVYPACKELFRRSIDWIAGSFSF